jgi:hypothetical protein
MLFGLSEKIEGAFAGSKASSVVKNALSGVNMDPKLKAWLCGAASSIVTAAVCGSLPLLAPNGHFSFAVTGAAFLGCLGHYLADSPLSFKIGHINVDIHADKS